MSVRADDLLILAEVARSGSLLRAAEVLGLDHSTVSRRLADLDRRVGHATVSRTVTGTRLTELGEALLSPATRIEEAMHEVTELVDGGRGPRHLSGLLRIACVEGFGVSFVTPVLARLMQEHPSLSIELSTGTRPIPQAIASDIEISVTAASARRARNVTLASYRLGLYASRAYLERAGTPADLAGLSAHPIIYYVESEMRVSELVVVDKRLPGNVVGFGSPNVFVQLAATVAGAGIGVLPAFLAAAHADLVPVLPTEFAETRTFSASISDRPATRMAAEAFLAELRREIDARAAELTPQQ